MLAVLDFNRRNRIQTQHRFCQRRRLSAECKLILSVTVRYVALDGVQIMAFRDGAYMLTNYVTITDSSITATDTSGNNILYKFTLDSQFPLIPTGEHTYYGCKGTFKKRWGHA